jgi:hypothetical protein
MPRRKKLIFWCLSVLLTCCGALVVAELGCTVFFLLKDRALEPVSEKLAREDDAYRAQYTRPGCSWGDQIQAHPYFGFVYKRQGMCASEGVNSLGFRGEEFPIRKDPSEHVILMAGGSLAQMYGETRTLEKALNASYLKGKIKHFRVLIAAAGAWKQPQGYLVFALLANKVDTVIMLDGFNEHFSFFPRSFRMENPPMDVRQRDLPGGVGGIWRAIGFTLDKDLYSLQRNSFFFRPSSAEIRAHARTLGKDDSFLAAPSILEDGMPPFPRLTRAQQLGRPWEEGYNIGQYLYYYKSMQAIADTNGVKAFYFLQPVPLIEKSLTEEEQRLNTIRNYRDIYLAQEKIFLSLKKQKLNVTSLTSIFSKETGKIYNDHIHVNQRGYELINKRLLEVIGPYLRKLGN